ncbi:hypothetical protein ACQPZU_04390 [Saccharomonospora azurea]|uniref:Uncharacterized protein n=1 Tax=Saccharomonospora azurea NA-128 TaxID=882081 RepID=H8G935_9PSEU|nr:hypothetical protein [Saccharomonospora azurea]EHY90516.1 hypothetical protein SacazDRAFT_03652 [Saccharomonospora azurea NA-128]
MSTAIHAHWQFIVRSADDLFASADKLMEALIAQEECSHGFTDVAVAVDGDRGIVEVEANASGKDLAHAVAVAQSCVRAAMHEVGISTPDWPSHRETMSMLLKELHTAELV